VRGGQVTGRTVLETIMDVSAFGVVAVLSLVV
jgi:hypothetical protein